MNLEVGSTNAFATVGKETPASTTTIHAGKHDSSSGLSTYDLAIALQYGQGTGSAQLVKFLTDHVKVCILVERKYYSQQKLTAAR